MVGERKTSCLLEKQNQLLSYIWVSYKVPLFKFIYGRKLRAEKIVKDRLGVQMENKIMRTGGVAQVVNQISETNDVLKF
jgi:hypothetical protein